MSESLKATRLRMLKCAIEIRMVEQYIGERYPEQKMRCPTHLCIGQEAVPAVFGTLAQKEDAFVGTYRSHGHYLAKGGNLTAMFAELLGSEHGCSGGLGGSMHLIDGPNHFMGSSAIVAGGVPIAAGAALSFKHQKQSQVAVAFTGDAALEEGVYYETVNFACLHHLPMIFVCENNGLAIATPIEVRQSSSELHKRFESLGIKSFLVKENDIEGLIKTAQAAYEYARSGQGPVFIEYKVVRWSGHVGHDVQGSLEGWWKDPLHGEQDFCSLSKFARPLLEDKSLSLAQLQELHQQTRQRIELAYKAAEAAYTVSDRPLEDYVFASGVTSVLPKGNLAKVQLSAVEPSKLINPF